ncbi:long-chain fatty acid--CoA ligase [Burkholderia cenocepacia]|jgi:fatty-acyl-CoA synthase|nr:MULTISPECIES: long-chain fatty acid--CoA ligase [Burkholderia]AMU14383.1 long-chain fatty acid--CoA ligase [Burkholderia cenocepacia]AMU17742.1 long-chain fatty acid--CoA ligase [Burkholderia cenocepacia]KVS23712.1 long-chain fatty acid--CoA ligase [Burkholderia vietnamiensis]MBR8014762.1 long-chain fatty acid--CoA ligase [Burkholderia vietnamiensis]MCW3588354.1 long-chain fatty acid--CoA ligase [Burkholderia cenocepacia]
MLGKMMREPLLVSSLIAHAARYHADTPVVSVNTTGGIEHTTWGQVEINARRLSSALAKLGVQSGERCATIAWNNRRHLEIYYGVSGAGMVCHTVNPRLSAETLIYIVNHADDQVLFIDRTFLPIVSKIRSALSTVKHVILMGPRDEKASDMLDGLQFYDEVVASGDTNYQWPSIDEELASSLCYTSGTTGHPKGVLYSHRSTVLHALAGNSPDGIGVSARDAVMPVVPMFHVNAWGVPYIAAAQGAKLVLPGPNLDGPSLAALMDDEEVDLALGVPTIWMGLLAALRARGTKPKSLKRTIVGGAALPPSMFAAFRDEFGVELIHAWGMTETSPLGTLNQPLARHIHLDPQRQSEVRLGQGRPPYGVQLRVVDDGGAVLPNDGKSPGKLQIRGHWIVSSYFGAESSALTSDGWFDTGDIATLDANGYMVIRDRAKDIIKSGGEWISSVEIENIAIGHPAIANAAAIGVPHPKWDERPVLVAVKKEGANVSEADLLAFFKGRLPDWQIPDKAVFIDALPLSGTGKVFKNRLREAYGGLLAGSTRESTQ